MLIRDDQKSIETLKDFHSACSIATLSGREIFPFEATEEMIDLDDIVQALSMKVRFTGQVSHFYSVAHHCLNAVRAARFYEFTDRIQRWALLHDATEAYLPDVASPLKPYLYVSRPPFNLLCPTPYKQVEDELETTIAKKFGLELPKPPEVKMIDAQLYRIERRILLPPCEGFETPAPDPELEAMIRGWVIEPPYRLYTRTAFMQTARDLGLAE